MYNTIYDAWDHKLYSVVTLKINIVFIQLQFFTIFHVPLI